MLHFPTGKCNQHRHSQALADFSVYNWLTIKDDGMDLIFDMPTYIEYD